MSDAASPSPPAKLVPGVPSALSPLVRRVVVPKPGPSPGAEVLAYGKRLDKDNTITPDRAIGEGDTIEGTEFGLEVLHTPGHAPNHLCFLLEEERGLFTGDTA